MDLSTLGAALAISKKLIDENDCLELFAFLESKNLYRASQYKESDYYNGSIILSNGTIRTGSSFDTYFYVTPKVYVNGNKLVTISFAPWGGSSLGDANRLRAYDENNTPLEQMTLTVNSDNSISFTTPEDTSYIRFTVHRTTGFIRSKTVFENEFMVVYGSNTDLPAQFDRYFDSHYFINCESNPLWLPIYAKSTLYGKKIVNFGDSIFGHMRPPYSVSDVIQQKTGATVYNCAFGGARMASSNNHYDALSMYRLAYAITHDDYSVQDDAMNYEDRTSYAEEPLALIKSIDFDDVDIITIAYGTNDFGADQHLDNANDKYDTSTTAGALRYSIEQILTRFPYVRLVIIGMIYRNMSSTRGEGADSDNETTYFGTSFKEFNEKLKEVADEYHLQFIDNNNNGLNKFNVSYLYNDGTHLNDRGIQVYADHLIRNLQ